MATGSHAIANMIAKATTLTVMQVVAAPMAGSDIGVNGPERRTANAVEHWGEHAIRPVVVYPRRGRLWHRFAAAGVELVDFEFGGKYDVAAVRRYAAIAKEHGVDVIHTQGPGSLDAIVGLAARRAGIPLVVTRPVMIEDLPVSAARRRIYRMIDKLSLRNAELVVAVSQAGLDHLRSTGVVGGRLRLIYNGIDVDRIAGAARDRPITPSGPVRVGMVAQLTVVKGWRDFLATIEAIRAMSRDVAAVVVGAGPLQRELAAAVEQRRLGDVVDFAGHREDVENALAGLDVFLFTSHREGLSVAVLEAMASGLPIVATRVGGIAEQVDDGVTGYLADVGDVVALARSVVALIDDAELRATMGARARAKAAELFSHRSMIEHYAHCYREAAESRR